MSSPNTLHQPHKHRQTQHLACEAQIEAFYWMQVSDSDDDGDDDAEDDKTRASERKSVSWRLIASLAPISWRHIWV